MILVFQSVTALMTLFNVRKMQAKIQAQTDVRDELIYGDEIKMAAKRKNTGAISCDYNDLIPSAHWYRSVDV